MTLEALIERVKTHIEEVGDCWEWNGAVQTTAPTPVIRIGGKTLAVRRAIALAQGKQVERLFVTCKCRNDLCVNPDHIHIVTRSKLQKYIAKERDYGTNPARRKRIADKARERSKLTMELAAEIREATGKQRDIALRFGISQATVSSIKRGATWRDYSNPFIQLLRGTHASKTA